MVLQPAYCLIAKPGNEISYLAYVNPLKQVYNIKGRVYDFLFKYFSVYNFLEHLDLCFCECCGINPVHISDKNLVRKF